LEDLQAALALQPDQTFLHTYIADCWRAKGEHRKYGEETAKVGVVWSKSCRTTPVVVTGVCSPCEQPDILQAERRAQVPNANNIVCCFEPVTAN
jgi:hypothetical protein